MRQLSFATVTKGNRDAKKTDQSNVNAPVDSPDPTMKVWPGTMTNERPG